MINQNDKAEIQESQYVFPYHYLAEERDGGIYIFKHLFWGLVHYTYIDYVIKKISETKFNTLADIGCGEGRIIFELEKRNISGHFCGYDISSRAITFAKAFTKYSHFLVHDITQSALVEKVDLIVSCEVIEHIEPQKVQEYINNIYNSLKSGGKIILTTPTKNVPVNTKHYQHFDSEMFKVLLQNKFTNITYEYLNQVNLRCKILERMLANRFYVSNWPLLNRFVLKQYRKHCLHAQKSTGSRILVTAVKIP